MRVIDVQTDKICENPANVRPAPPESELRPLGESLAEQQWVPIIVQATTMAGFLWMLLDGFRRLLAARLVGLKTLKAIEVAPGTSASDIVLITDMHKVGLTHYQRALAGRNWLEENPGATSKDLATKLKLNPSMISKDLSLWRTIPAVQEAAEAGRIGPTIWWEICKGDAKAQHEMLAAALNGASRDEIERKVRKARNGLQDQDRLNRIRVELPNKISVVVSGTKLTLDNASRAAMDASRVMVRGEKEGLTAKTITKVSVEWAAKEEKEKQKKSGDVG